MTPRRPQTRDHIRPRVKGGTFEEPRNRALVCEGCNRDKGNRSLVAFLAWLIERRDPRAERVLWRPQSLIARGLVDLCGE